jgi:hypothetical protein
MKTVRRRFRFLHFQLLSQHEQSTEGSELLLCAPWAIDCRPRTPEIFDCVSQIIGRPIEPRSNAGVNLPFQEKLGANVMNVQAFL